MPRGTPALLWRTSVDDVVVVPRSRVPQEALMPEVGPGRNGVVLALVGAVCT